MSDERQYLTFLLDGEDYAIDILRVQEIRGYAAITPIPNTPAHLRGVMNLRGNVVPVIDLRLRLGMNAAAYGPATVIVLVTIGARVHGLIVDSVSDVLHLAPSAIEPAPDLGAAVDLSFISGMAKPTGRLIIVLDVDRVVGVETAARAAPASITDHQELRS